MTSFYPNLINSSLWHVASILIHSSNGHSDNYVLLASIIAVCTLFTYSIPYNSTVIFFISLPFLQLFAPSSFPVRPPINQFSPNHIYSGSYILRKLTVYLILSYTLSSIPILHHSSILNSILQRSFRYTFNRFRLTVKQFPFLIITISIDSLPKNPPQFRIPLEIWQFSWFAILAL